jgi:hypothetical protein
MSLSDLGDEAVGHLLQVDERMTLVVLGHFLVLEQLLQVIVGIAADVAHGDARGLRFLVHDLGELPAPLLGHRGHRERITSPEVAGLTRGR